MNEETLLKLFNEQITDLPPEEPIVTEIEKEAIIESMIYEFNRYFPTELKLGTCTDDSLVFLLNGRLSEQSLLDKLKNKFEINRIEICDIDFYLTIDDYDDEIVGTKISMNVFLKG